MTREPVFVKFDGYYGYLDYWKLIELSGFRTCQLDNVDLLSGETYIISVLFRDDIHQYLTSQIKIHNGRKVSKIVGWDLEPPNSPWGCHLITRALLDQYWVSDRSLRTGQTKAVVFGSHPDIASCQPLKNKDIDVAFIGMLSPRRNDALEALKKSGLNVAITTFEPERGKVLSRSRAMLNIPYRDSAFVAPPRFSVAAAYSLPILSEPLNDPWPLEPSRDILIASAQNFTDACIGWMKNENLESMGQNIHRRLVKEMNFKTNVLLALSDTSQTTNIEPISIIIPTIGRRSLKRTLESISTQIWKQDEVIVVGDGMQDGARKMTTSFGGCFRYLETKQTRAWGDAQRSYGMDVAKGTYLAFMDDDDIYLPGALETMHSAIKQNKAFFLFKIECGNGVIWNRPEISINNVSTQMILIKNIKSLPRWSSNPDFPYGSGGDFQFIKAAAQAISEPVCFRQEIVARLEQRSWGSPGEPIL